MSTLPAVRQTQALAPVERPGADTFQTMGELVKLAEMVQNADGMIPKHFLRQPGKILAAFLAGQELGVGPMASLRSIHVVEGKPCADYSFWVARLRAHGYELEWRDCGPETATLILTSPGGHKHTETWDKARATKALLWNGKDNWKKYPETMLKARCVTSAGRAFAGEVMYSCYLLDEADEIRGTAAVDDAPAPSRPSGMAGLAQRIGVTDPPADAEPSPDAAELPPVVEQPLPPLDFAEEVVEAFNGAQTMADVSRIADAIKGRFTGEDMKMCAAAYRAAKQRNTDPDAAAEDKARRDEAAGS